MAEPHSIVPLSGLRKVIATRMTLSQTTIPHFRLVTDIQTDRLLGLREQVRQESSQQGVSVNDCIVKACASALIENPGMNIQLVDSSIHYYQDADISVVVAIEGGVVSPVVRRANKKSVFEISAEMRELVAKSRSNRLKMDDILGGTFSISNLGSSCVDQFDAIISPPQGAILAVGRIRSLELSDKVLPSERAATRMRVTLSLDHRAIDGALGAAFLKSLRHHLEEPEHIFDMKYQ